MALKEQNSKLADSIAMLPGDNAEAHRRIMVDVLDNLPRALRLANGAVESPEFSNAIGTIESAHQTADVYHVPTSRLQAVENQALLAAAAALHEIRDRKMFDDDQLPAMLDNLNKDINKATNTIGPLHDVDVTHAFNTLENVLQRVTNDMNERFGAAGPGTPPPQ
jgi:hypothetical protein